MALIHEFAALFFFVSLATPSHIPEEDNRELMYTLLASLPKPYRSMEQSVANRNNFYNDDSYDLNPRDTQMLGNALRSLMRHSKGGVSNEITEEKRFDWGGLLCCNHPPTRPPTTKRMGGDDKLRSLIMSKIMQSMMEENGGNGFEDYQLEPSSVSYWDDSRSQLEKRRDEMSNPYSPGTNEDKSRANRRQVTVGEP